VKRAALVILLVLLVDQALKVWMKTQFYLGESVPMFGESCHWAYLQFVENRGMAFGLEFGGPLGKLSLTLFRIIAVIGIGWLLVNAIKRERGLWLTTSLALIFAGALGNIIDSAFYGVLFSESLPFQKAVFLPPDGGYAPPLHGAVVDMLYFPLWEGRIPEWFPIWGGEHFEFFRPVFNIADAAISVGVVLLLFSQRKAQQTPSPLPSEQMAGAPTTITEVAPPPPSPTAPEEVTGPDRPEDRTGS
jgi:signal peptidase II